MKHTYQGSKIIVSGQDAIYTLSGSPIIVLGVYRHFDPVCPLHGAVRASYRGKEHEGSKKTLLPDGSQMPPMR